MKASDLSIFNHANFKWFFKYKIYHLPFWLVYHTTIWTLTIGSLADVFHHVFFSPLYVKFLFGLFFQALGVYLNLYLLIPKFLEKDKYLLYISLLLINILFISAFIVSGYYVTAFLSDKTFQELFYTHPGNFFHFFKVNALPSTMASITLGMSVKLTKNWIQAKRREQLLEKEKIETELKFLKSQFNPHFLFNTINSIFVLIHKNPHMASDALAKFSDLLRYQLYECNEQEILLTQEIIYLENFIELQKLRQERQRVELILGKEQPVSYLLIAPFVLMPFIENAFKHVSKFKNKENWIKIELKLDQKRMYFSISNSIDIENNKTRQLLNYSGIGLKNVQRRLNLLYPDEHKLAVEQDKQHFKVTLVLDLHERIMSANLNMQAS